jgi:hypothetical protein
MKQFFSQRSAQAILAIATVVLLFVIGAILTGGLPRYPGAKRAEYCPSSGYFHKPDVWSNEFSHCFLTLDSRQQFQNWYIKNRFWPFDYLPGREPNFPEWNLGHLSFWAEQYTRTPDLLASPPWTAIEIRIIYIISWK